MSKQIKLKSLITCRPMPSLATKKFTTGIHGVESIDAVLGIACYVTRVSGEVIGIGWNNVVEFKFDMPQKGIESEDGKPSKKK